MNILLLTEGFYPKTGGGAYTNWEFAKYASEKGHDVTVFTTKLKNTDSIETKRGVKIFRPHPGAQQTKHSSLEFFKRIQFLLKVYSSCSTWLKKNSADVIFSTTHLTHPVAKLVGIIHDIPVINFIAYSPSLEETERSWTNPRFLFEQLNIFGCMGDIVFTRTKNIKHMIYNNSFSSPSVQTIDGVLRKDKILSSVKSTNQEQVDCK
ncbi:MAG: glycosyltransferase, partial [Candidatus Paceibacteria bacterium]